MNPRQWILMSPPAISRLIWWNLSEISQQLLDWLALKFCTDINSPQWIIVRKFLCLSIHPILWFRVSFKVHWWRYTWWWVWSPWAFRMTIRLKLSFTLLNLLHTVLEDVSLWSHSLSFTLASPRLPTYLILFSYLFFFSFSPISTFKSWLKLK